MSAVRTVVRYDDIASTGSASSNAPATKRKKTQASLMSAPSHKSVQHWDDPGTSSQDINYDDDGGGSVDSSEESRDLTYEEIWDDSALIEAWNAATEEYEAFHGPDKGWKKDPIHKSPLWYNIPPIQKDPRAGSSTSKKAKPKAANGTTVTPDDSQPLNFDTYVPHHDPTLNFNGTEPTLVYAGESPMVSQDEAFERAVSASYWTGYWSAVYHYHRHMTLSNDAEGEEPESADEDQDERATAGDDGDYMMSTQR